MKSLFRVDPKPTIGVLPERERDTEAYTETEEEEGHETVKAELRVGKSRNIRGCHAPPEVRKKPGRIRP